MAIFDPEIASPSAITVDGTNRRVDWAVLAIGNMPRLPCAVGFGPALISAKAEQLGAHPRRVPTSTSEPIR